MRDDWVPGDFNGLFGDLLCLSHEDTVTDQAGRTVALRAGMVLTAFDYDADDAGRPAYLFATGVVEPSPEWLQCNGSRWALRIDPDHLRWEPREPEGSSA